MKWLILLALVLLTASGPSTATARSGLVSDLAWLDGDLRADLDKRPLRAPMPPARQPLDARATGEATAAQIVGAASADDLDAVVQLARGIGAVSRVNRALATVHVAPAPGAVLDALRADPRVAFVEPDRVLHLRAEQFEVQDPQAGLPFTWWFDQVRAAEALALVPGAPFPVAVIDTGAEMGHADLQGALASPFNATYGGTDVTDFVGHGTFVAGLISAAANGIGVRGVAGTTPVMPIRASIDGSFESSVVAYAIVHATDSGARVVNMSFGAEQITEEIARALAYAYLNDVVLVAAAGNEALDGNPIEYPAAFIGGSRGDWGIGLSVGATTPGGAPAAFSNFNDYVGIAAPGASEGSCRFGVFSTIPAAMGITAWDSLDNCSDVYGRAYEGAGRWAYGEGTSFSAPIVAGAAALVLAAKPSLASEQVARVLQLSARRGPYDPAWNPNTGYGIVDARAAVELAATFDTADPTVSASAKPARAGVRVTATAADRANPGEAPAGGITFDLEISTDAGATYTTVVTGVPSLNRVVPSEPGASVAVRVWACDANRNCGRWDRGGLRRANRRPALRSVSGQARRGGIARLRYNLFDDGGRTRESIVIRQPGGQIVKRIRTGFGRVRTTSAGRYFVPWRVGRRARVGRYVFCVVATDGKLSSRRSCAFLRVHP